jgi:hypothetical protein
MPRLAIFYFLILGFSSVGSATALETNASLGLAVDSAASLEDLSPNAGSRNSHSDNVTIFEAGIAGEPLSGLTFSYDFSSEEFSDYSENSTISHSIGGGYEREIGDWSLGLSGDYISMALDGDDYLDMAMFIPSLSYFRNQTYLMTSIIFQEKSFVDLTQLDAEMTQYSLLAFQFFNSYRSYFSIGYSTAEEDSETPDYDFDEKKFAIGVTHPIAIGGRTYETKLTYETRSRDYPKVVNAELKSDEDRDSIQFSLATSLTDSLELELFYDFKDRKANIADATYDSHVTALRLNFRR